VNEKYRYLRNNVIIMSISTFGTKILSFLLVPLYTAILTTTEYGVADLITTTATLLVFVLTINISSSVLRFVIEKKEKGNQILSFGIRVMLRGTLVCSCGCALVWALKLFDWPYFYYLFLILYFFSTAFYELMSNYLRAIDKVSSVAVAGVLSSAVMIASNIVFLLVFKVGVIGYLISLITGPFVASFYCMVVAREPLTTYFHSKCDKQLKNEMVKYCVPLIFNNTALWINAFLDRYFVTYFCGVSENGVYSVASKIPNILATCYSVFASAWTLSAIKEFDSKDQDGFFSDTYNTYGALMTSACSLIVLFNIPLAKILYSNDFFAAWQYSSVLLMSVMFNTLTVFQGSLFSAAKKTNSVAVTTIISALTNTLLNALLIPTLGALGAAIATVIAYFVMWGIRFVCLRELIELRVNVARDMIIYLVIAIQIFFEHLENHCYVGQALCFIIIILLNRKYIISIIGVMMRRVRDGKNKRDF